MNACYNDPKIEKNTNGTEPCCKKIVVRPSMNKVSSQNGSYKIKLKQ